MNILLVDNGTKYIHQLTKLTSGHQVVTKKYSDIVGDDSSKYDLIILSGGHNFPVQGSENLLEKEFRLVHITKTPILGICFGFELIAKSFGAIMKKMESKESGIITINQVIDDPIFTNITNIEVFESHRWVVTQVSDELQALANSSDGIEIIKHKSKFIYGFQFHPEMFSDVSQGDEIFANFMKIVQNRYL